MFLKKTEMRDTENRNNVESKTFEKIRKMTEIRKTKIKKKKTEKVENKKILMKTKT